MERACVFIDGSNFYFALKRNNRATRVDYHQLSLALAGPDRELVRTFYYNVAYDKNAFPEKAKSQMSFLDSLDRTPYLELRLGRLVPTADGSVQERGVDVLLASDLVYYAARKIFDTAIVVTEDGDFSRCWTGLRTWAGALRSPPSMTAKTSSLSGPPTCGSPSMMSWINTPPRFSPGDGGQPRKHGGPCGPGPQGIPGMNPDRGF